MYTIAWIAVYFTLRQKGVRISYFIFRGKIMANSSTPGSMPLQLSAHVHVHHTHYWHTWQSLYIFKHSDNPSPQQHLICYCSCYAGVGHKKHSYKALLRNANVSPGGHSRSKPWNVCLQKLELNRIRPPLCTWSACSRWAFFCLILFLALSGIRQKVHSHQYIRSSPVTQ